MTMSYCRWSSDKFKSTVYVYASQDGYVIHVAGNTIVGEGPEDPYSYEWIMKVAECKGDQDVLTEWERVKVAWEEWLEAAPREQLPAPHAGQIYTLDTPGECADKLREIKAAGLHVPDGVIEDLDQEELEGSDDW